MRKKVTHSKKRYEGSLEEDTKEDSFNECMIRRKVLKPRNVKNIKKINSFYKKKIEKWNKNYYINVSFEP